MPIDYRTGNDKTTPIQYGWIFVFLKLFSVLFVLGYIRSHLRSPSGKTHAIDDLFVRTFLIWFLFLSFCIWFVYRPSEMMIETSPSHQFAGSDHPNTLQLIDHRNSICMNRQYQHQRTLTTTIVTMNDDEFVTTPTKRPRGNSVLEESLLNAGNYLRRKFSYGSSDWQDPL